MKSNRFESHRLRLHREQTPNGIFSVTKCVQPKRPVLNEEIREFVVSSFRFCVERGDVELRAFVVMPDHFHIFIGMKPSIALSDLVRDIKNNSCTFINEKKWIGGKFNWQEGFAAFSYGHSQIDAVVKYIQNQEQHHAKKTFKEEYLELLKKFHVEYDQRYLFKWVEDE